MLVLTQLLGWTIYLCGIRLGGRWGGLLCLAAYVTTPAFLLFGPLVITDLPITLFTLIALWRVREIWAEPAPQRVDVRPCAGGIAAFQVHGPADPARDFRAVGADALLAHSG
jgi:hypothetical protein